MTHVYMCHIKKYGPIDFYFFFSILSYIEMYMIKKIFCIGDGIKSILSLKINIFIYNNILFYCTDFCVNYHIKYILKKNQKKKTKYNIFFLHTFLKVHDDQYLGRTSLKLMCERIV